MGVGTLSRSLRVVVVMFGCIAGGVLSADTVGAAAAPPEYEKSFGPDGTESSGFGRTGAVAVDGAAEVLYVIDHNNGTLLKFDLEGNPVNFSGSAPYISGNEITGLSFSPSIAKTQVAVDENSHEFYVTSGNSITAFQADGEASEFTAGPGAGTNSIGGFAELIGLTVDGNGVIYASDFEETVSIYSSAGTPITQFVAERPANLAVDTNGNLYVNRWQGVVRKFSPSEFPVTASTSYSTPFFPFETEFSYSVGVDRTTNDVYTTHFESNPGVSQYNEAGELMATFGGSGEEGALGLSEGVAAIGGKTGTVFVSNAPEGGLSQVEVFKHKAYVGPPLIENVYADSVTSESARLHAQINPGSFETSYWFEYGLADCSVSLCASIPLGGESIGGGDGPVAVSQTVSGLEAETTYHFRVRAENLEGSGGGPGTGDRSFTTQTGALGFQLSDSRVWEMVSPANKHGGVLVNNGAGLIQASENGSALAYLSKGPVAGHTVGNRSPERATTLAHRGTGGGWSSEDIMPSNERVVPLLLGMDGEYKLFSPDLERALVEPLSGTPLSPEASERTPYLRGNTNPPLYTPMVTGKEGFANVPPGTKFGGETGAPPVRIEAASTSLEHAGLRSSVPLVGPEDPAQSLYEWSGGQLHRVNVLPDSEGGGLAFSSVFGSNTGSMRHAISDDGARVFWGTGQYADTGNSLTGLYLRDTAAETTVRLDVVQPGASGSGVPRPVFQGANPEGTTVIFTDSQQLTDEASPNGFDLYSCEIPAGSPASGCSTLTNVTGSTEGGPGESAEVQGILSGLSRDGSALYFVAKGVLDGTPNGEGESAVAGAPNLYGWNESGGPRFIAILSPEDSQSWGVFKSGTGTAEALSAGSSPSGRYLAFMSQRSLTGYDNRDAASSEPAQEVFRYDAVADQLDCVSCNPSGGAPLAFIDPNPLEPPLFDPRGKWVGRLLAAALPEASAVGLSRPSIYRSRFMLDNGRVFFNAFDALVSGDSNGEWDVYQYESIGVGGCTTSSGDAGTAKAAGGCVSLMSSGAAAEESALLDTSASGDDVFFLTSARLAVTDVDGELDIYDARVNGVAPVLPEATECSGDSCQPLTMPPAEGTTGSSSFTGRGNLKPPKRCAKSKRRMKQGGKVRCVPRKQKRPPRKSSSSRGRDR